MGGPSAKHVIYKNCLNDMMAMANSAGEAAFHFGLATIALIAL